MSQGARRVSGGHGKIFSEPKLAAIPAQNVAAFAAQETEVDNVQRIPERERKTNVEYSSTSLDNETTFFHPGSNRHDQTYDWHPDTIQNDATDDRNLERNQSDRTHDWHRETNQNDRTEDWHSETNWNNRNPEIHRNDRTHDRNPQTDQNDQVHDRKPEANQNNRNPEAAQNDRTQHLNVPQNGNAPQAGAGTSSILHWTKKMLTINFPIYWIVIVVGILGAASLVCGVLIGAVLCANGNRSFPFFLRVKSRAGHAAY